MTILNFNCKKCEKEFDFNVGRIKIFSDQKINFQKNTKCPYCGESSKEFLEITEENTRILCKIYDEQEKKETIKEYFPGKLVGYSAIFGRDSNIQLSFDSNNYYVLDNYCVVPDCNCNEVIVDFYLKNNGKSPAEWSFSFDYDYSNGKISKMKGLDYRQSKEIIELLIKKIQLPFKQRHNNLKNFFKGEVCKRTKKQFFKGKKSPIKVGRNEPCPCGSGKKYKKCCLEKEGKQR